MGFPIDGPFPNLDTTCIYYKRRQLYGRLVNVDNLQ